MLKKLKTNDKYKCHGKLETKENKRVKHTNYSPDKQEKGQLM